MIKYVSLVVAAAAIGLGGYAVYQDMLIKKVVKDSMAQETASAVMSKNEISRDIKFLGQENKKIESQIVQLKAYDKAQDKGLDQFKAKLMKEMSIYTSPHPSVKTLRNFMHQYIASNEFMLGVASMYSNYPKSSILANLDQSVKILKKTPFWSASFAAKCNKFIADVSELKPITPRVKINQVLSQLQEALKKLHFGYNMDGSKKTQNTIKAKTWKQKLKASLNDMQELVYIRADHGLGTVLFNQALQKSIVASVQYGLQEMQWTVIQQNNQLYHRIIIGIERVVNQNFAADSQRTSFNNLLKQASSYTVGYPLLLIRQGVQLGGSILELRG